MNWLKQIKGVKKVFLTHGEEMQRQAFAEKIHHEFGIKDIYLPDFGDKAKLE